MALYKRPGSKYYWMKFTFAGQLVQQSTKCKARRDAETVEHVYRTRLAEEKVGLKSLKKPIPFKKAALEFLEWSQVSHAQKPASHTRIKYSTENLIRYFGSKLVNRIEKSDIERFIIFRSKQTSLKTDKPITGGTINLELIALKTILRRLVSERYLHESPASEVKLLPKNKRTFHVLTADEEKIYLMACPQPLQDVATVILETGMRPKEVYELTRDRVDTAAGSLLVTEGKTESSNRTVWLTDRAAAIIRRRLESFKGKHLFPKGDRDGEGPTYPLNDQHATTLTRTGMAFRIYDCRHTFSTRKLEEGTDLITLAAILGHGSLDELKTYAHPSENLKREAVQKTEKRSVRAG